MNIYYYSLAVIVFLTVLYILAARKTLFKKLLIIAFVAFSMVYMVWRACYTIPTDSWPSFIAGILLFVAEFGGFMLSLVFYRLFFVEDTRENVTLNALKGNFPTVDVFIATYNEDETILKRIIVASQSMRYPNKALVKVHVLDDGDRPEIRVLTESLGANYLRRDTHEHAKAGNLNNGLANTQGELIVTLDADMVPRVDFLERMIGYFADEKMGFVQSPQTFFNEDPYQFNLFASHAINNDQDFFMRSIESQKDLFNSTMYIGSNAVFRRAALDEIGGFSTGVITEDMATGMLVQAKGWHSRYVNENLASGLAPETFGDLVKQRDRWARGNIQVIRKWNPCRIKGLSLTQKIIYMDGIHYWLSSNYKVIFLLAPIFYLLFGVASLHASLHDIALFWLPAFLASQLAFNIVSEGKQKVMLTNVYETVMAPFMAFAVISEGVFKAQNKFVVTRKGVKTDKTQYNWRLGLPILVLFSLSIIAMVKGILVLVGFSSAMYTSDEVYINLFWVIYNLTGLTLAVFLLFDRPRFRKAERFTSDKPATLELSDGEQLTAKLLDWNENGAGLSIVGYVRQHCLGQPARLIVEGYAIECEIVRQFVVEGEPTETFIGLSINEISYDSYAYLISQTYAVASDEYVDHDRHNSVLKMFMNILKRPIGK